MSDSNRIDQSNTPRGTSQQFIRVKDLSKAYGEGEAHSVVLDHLSVDIYKGEICVLLGPSGSGKSTFLNILGGLESADGGEVRVGDKVLTAMNSKHLGEYRRSHLGFVFQFYNLVPDLTIRENIEVCQQLSANPLPIDDLLHQLGLWEQRNKFPNQVSGGQQQRCSIGRALVKNPQLLLCDEPTGALDYETSKEILHLIETVNKRYGTTVVIVTHNSAIAGMAQRILRLHDGQMAQNTVNEQVIPALDLNW